MQYRVCCIEGSKTAEVGKQDADERNVGKEAAVDEGEEALEFRRVPAFPEDDASEDYMEELVHALGIEAVKIEVSDER